jgi:hypothetical protein
MRHRRSRHHRSTRRPHRRHSVARSHLSKRRSRRNFRSGGPGGLRISLSHFL